MLYAVQELEEQLLGQGNWDGRDWELVYRTASMPPLGRPNVSLRVGGNAGGGSVPETLDKPLGGVGITRHADDRLRAWIHGEVQPTYESVFIECVDGLSIEASVVDCETIFGFNFYVAATHYRPVRVVAKAVDGRRAFLQIDNL
jgi:hypothetical protein